MLFKIEGKRTILNHEYYRVTLRTYKDGQASPDVFSDFEIDVPIDYQREEGGEAYILTEIEFLKIVRFWREEVDTFNNDLWSVQFGERCEQAQVDFYDFYVEGLE